MGGGEEHCFLRTDLVRCVDNVGATLDEELQDFVVAILGGVMGCRHVERVGAVHVGPVIERALDLIDVSVLHDSPERRVGIDDCAGRSESQVLVVVADGSRERWALCFLWWWWW